MIITNLEMVASIIVIQIFIILYVVNKDKAIQKKVRTIAKSVAEVDRHLYEMEMRVNERFKNLQLPVDGLSETEIEMLADGTVSTRLLPIEQALHHIQNEFSHVQEQMQHQIIQLDSTIKTAARPATSMGTSDDKKILQLYEDGKDTQSIAKELRISNAEVEFSLKVAQFS